MWLTDPTVYTHLRVGGTQDRDEEIEEQDRHDRQGENEKHNPDSLCPARDVADVAGRLEALELEVTQHRLEHRQEGIRERAVLQFEVVAVLARVEERVQSESEARQEDGDEDAELAQVGQHLPDYLGHGPQGIVDLRERQDPREEGNSADGQQELRQEPGGGRTAGAALSRSSGAFTLVVKIGNAEDERPSNRQDCGYIQNVPGVLKEIPAEQSSESG